MTKVVAHIIGPLGVPELPLISADEIILVAVDRGLDRAREGNLAPDIVVGDFDSVSPLGLAWLDEMGLDIEIHRVDACKDFSDLDLALRVCEDKRVTHAVLHGFIGGRIDHQLVVLGVCHRYTPKMSIKLVDGEQTITFLNTTQSYEVKRGARFSLIALSDVACVTIEGARYPLTRHPLAPLSDLGLSNYATAESVVTIHEGSCILVEQKIPRISRG